MDGAWALYEAWVRLQHGDVDTALVYAFGKSSLGDLREVLTLPARPVLRGAARPDPVALAALQARALLDAAPHRRASWPRSSAAAARDGGRNPYASSTLPERPPDDVRRRAAARPHDCPPITDGAAAVVLAAGDLARELCERPAWIRGIDHRIEPHCLGVRDLARSASTRLAAERAGGGRRRRSTSPSCTRRSPTRSSILREALGLRRRRVDQPVGRRAGRQPGHGRRPHPHRRGGPPHHRRRGRPARVGPRHRRAPACSRTSCASWRGRDEQRALRRHRRRPDAAHGQARRRVDRRAGPRGRRCARSTTPG